MVAAQGKVQGQREKVVGGAGRWLRAVCAAELYEHERAWSAANIENTNAHHALPQNYSLVSRLLFERGSCTPGKARPAYPNSLLYCYMWICCVRLGLLRVFVCVRYLRVGCVFVL